MLEISWTLQRLELELLLKYYTHLVSLEEIKACYTKTFPKVLWTFKKSALKISELELHTKFHRLQKDFAKPLLETQGNHSTRIKCKETFYHTCWKLELVKRPCFFKNPISNAKIHRVKFVSHCFRWENKGFLCYKKCFHALWCLNIWHQVTWPLPHTDNFINFKTWLQFDNVIYGLLMSHLDQKKIILKQVKKWSCPQIEGFEANLARDSMHQHLMDGQLPLREP